MDLFSYFEAPPIPEDSSLQMVMMAGGMYVEEGNIIEIIRENIQNPHDQEELKEFLIRGFCPLDMNAEEFPAEDLAEILRDGWGIESKEEFTDQLERLLTLESQKVLVEMRRLLDLNPHLDLAYFNDHSPLAQEFYIGEEEFNGFVELLKKRSEDWKEGLGAWDIARFVHLLRLGFLGSLMSQDEVEDYLKKIHPTLQENFKSWEKFGKSYLHGREFWQGERDHFDEIIETLSTDPLSPWKHFPIN